MNYMLHFKGTKRDFGKWKKNGASWSFSDVEEYLNGHISDSGVTGDCLGGSNLIKTESLSCENTFGSFTRYNMENIVSVSALGTSLKLMYSYYKG